MKRFRYTKLFGWFAAAILLLTTSCIDDLISSDGSSDEVTVSFTLTPEALATMPTRADDGRRVQYPTQEEWRNNGWGRISDGSKADMLIYALYEEKGGKYELLDQYSDGNDFAGTIVAAKGQTIKKITTFPVTVTLTLKRNVKYSIAFWAQSSKTNAYDTSDLRKVEVRYTEHEEAADGTPPSEAAQINDEGGEDENSSSGENSEYFQPATSAETATPNNDEFRDVFCRSLNFIAGKQGLEQNVYLYRPLAQINVGTSGYDFETITRNADKKYLYSKIRLNRVARYLDVVEDKTYSSTTDPDESFSSDNDKKTAESFAVVDFGYAPLPAYVNYRDNNSSSYSLPKYPSYTVWDWKNNNSSDPYTHPHEYPETVYEKEEFLKVHLYSEEKKQEGFDDNKTYTKDKYGEEYTYIDKESGETEQREGDDGYLDYANLSDYDGRKSETFKYLSMCYVLTSSTKDENILINNVKVWLATDETGAGEIEIVNLNNVPARRNWRTNIIGDLLTKKTILEVSLDKDFAGEYNGWANDNGDWEYLSGPLAKGVYYDAKNDEIQISDKDGLLWFQRMVNGKLIVRDKAQSGTGGDEPYCYYPKTSVLNTERVELEYEIVEKPEDTDLLKRILRATHQDQNSNSDKNDNYGWPKNGNFHFCGANGPAYVRLMADIDLQDEEWIPIGWDVKVHDTSIGTNGAFNYNDFDETDGTQRAFCGIFDGNGHTISNLHNKEFSAEVHQTALQTRGKEGPYDNVQWLPSGFFGMIGGWRNNLTNPDGGIKKNSGVTNLRLFNVKITGYHTGAGIAAIVNSKKDAVNITNCIVDGTSIILSPMYRGDIKDGNLKDKDRTFARGIYLGGIVGHWVANGEISNCEVRNVTLKAYRQIGGLVGSISNYEQRTSWPNDWNSDSPKFELSIKDNKLDNVLIIADKFQPYDFIANRTTDEIIVNNVKQTVPGVWKNGFGWRENQASLANTYVGGTPEEQYAAGNTERGTQFTEFNTGVGQLSTERVSKIGNVPLKHFPMLSSWFCDDISLEGNYYGEPSAYIRCGGNETFYAWTTNKTDHVSVPFNLPSDLEVAYDKTSTRAAMYVESVTLDGGKNSVGNRSVITPDGLDKDGCVMFVTARDRKQFLKLLNPDGQSSVKEKEQGKYKDGYKTSTNIKNVVLRGTPYAHTGMLLSPNSNMNEVKLYNVAIYDVYQTLALDENYAEADKTNTQNDITPILTVEKSNFRGYTVPGAAWSQITYTGTTFEQGTYTGNGDKEKTYMVEAPTTFQGCYFKAPYIIDLSFLEDLEDKTKVDFSETYATAASPTNKQITLKDASDNLDAYKASCTHIVITADAQGVPVITYYYNYGEEGERKLLVE